LVSSASGQEQQPPQQPPLVGRQLEIRLEVNRPLAFFCGSLRFGCFLLHGVGNGSSLLGWLA
jgi:hypothetical protein